MARQQLAVAAQYLELDSGLHQVLASPARTLIVHFPVVITTIVISILVVGFPAILHGRAQQ
jgi:hypothetical protein